MLPFVLTKTFVWPCWKVAKTWIFLAKYVGGVWLCKLRFSGTVRSWSIKVASMDSWRTVVVHATFCFDQDLCMTLLQGFKYFNYVPHTVWRGHIVFVRWCEASHNWFLCDNLRMSWPIHFKFDVCITHGQRKVPFEKGHQVVPPDATRCRHLKTVSVQ